MATSLDVAAYILEQRGVLSATKLQKLVYYSQAWNLVWEDKPLFNEHIEAWANGPVVPALYRAHRLQYMVEAIPGGDSSQLTEREKSNVDSVLGFYGDHSAFFLSELTHREDPWLHARAGLPAGARSSNEVTTAAMAEYYGSLV